jgi:hypothetical protein
MLSAVAIGCRWWVVEDVEGSIRCEVKSQSQPDLFTFDEVEVSGGSCSGKRRVKAVEQRR